MEKQSVLSKHTEISSSPLPLVFLQQAFHIATAGEHRLERTSNTSGGPFTGKIQFSPGAARRTSVCCSGAGGLLPWAKGVVFLIDTQASGVIWKLSHFLLFHRKNSSFHMEYLRSGWCMQSIFDVSLLYACTRLFYCAYVVSYTKSRDGGVLPSVEQDFNTLGKPQN